MTGGGEGNKYEVSIIKEVDRENCMPHYPTLRGVTVDKNTNSSVQSALGERSSA